MRRSICVCEPHFTYAGHTYTWKFVYTTSLSIAKGGRVRFDILSLGRDIDWEAPDVNLKKQGNLIYLKIDGEAKPVPAVEIEQKHTPVPIYEFTMPKEVKAGEKITVVMGMPETGAYTKSARGNASQKFLQRRRPFNLSVDPKGNGKFGETEVFTIDIRGNVLHRIRAIVPSFVIKNKRFDIVLRFEDEFGNLTSHAPSDTLIDLTYEHLRENLKWQLFVPETGFIVLPNLYFNEAGVYKIQLKNNKTQDVFTSAPIKCFADGEQNVYWGTLHGESERYDSGENVESCLRHFRDEKAFNFYGTSNFESAEETSNEAWKLVTQYVADFNENERFSTFLGCQWEGEHGTEGVRHFVHLKDAKPILRKKDSKNGSLKKVYRHLSPKEVISIPVFTMSPKAGYNFEEFDPDFERLVEVYNAWGSSETVEAQGNTTPIRVAGKGKGTKEFSDGAIDKALAANCRFGFVAGGLDDRGTYGKFFDEGQEQYNPGLTAILVSTLTREELFNALYQRKCYATTGERIIVGIYVAGQGMGQELNTADKPGLLVNRHISGYVAGTSALKTVEIIRNGKVLKSFKPDNYHFDYTYDDLDPFAKVALQTKNKEGRFAYYYLRVTQEDGHMAWSSPIWVDEIKGAKRKPVVPA